jgi:hypothetical protein
MRGFRPALDQHAVDSVADHLSCYGVAKLVCGAVGTIKSSQIEEEVRVVREDESNSVEPEPLSDLPSSLHTSTCMAAVPLAKRMPSPGGKSNKGIADLKGGKVGDSQAAYSRPVLSESYETAPVVAQADWEA